MTRRGRKREERKGDVFSVLMVYYRVFGQDLAPRIEAYIRDNLNGEQTPGSAFLMETGSYPCLYVVCTCVVSQRRHSSV